MACDPKGRCPRCGYQNGAAAARCLRCLQLLQVATGCSGACSQCLVQSLSEGSKPKN